MIDFYKILGIPRDASLDEINRAFRKQAELHHPDKGGDPEEFKLINEARSVLRDQTLRDQYDAGIYNPYSGSPRNSQILSTAVDLLHRQISQILNTGNFSINIIDAVKKHVKNEIIGIDQNNKVVQNVLTRIKSMEDRFITDDEENIVLGILTNERERAKQAHSQNLDRLVIFNKVLELLDHYEYTADPAEPQYVTFTQQYSNTTTGSGW